MIKQQRKYGKLGLLLILILLLTALAAVAEAAQAPDLTSRCDYDLNGSHSVKALTDRKFTTYWESKKSLHPYVIITSPEPVYGLYLCFRTLPEQYEIQAARGEDWVTVQAGDQPYYHAFYPLGGELKIRILATGEAKETIGFNEISVFGEGKVPAWVQRWEPTPEKTDLLFVIAHPEEEALYLGGAIPYYACGKQCSVAVATLTQVNTTRRSELLNSLWSMGYRYYPIIGSFRDAKGKDAKAAFKSAGREDVYAFVTGAIRQTKPEVIVTMDESGEGKNGQRMMAAEACRECFSRAADASQDPDSAKTWGTWQAQKLYLHLYGDDPTRFDWTRRVENMGGWTGIGLAYRAFQYYKTRESTDLTVFGTGTTYANDTFGLAETLVGPDEEKNDFLEHIPEERRTKAGVLEDLESIDLSEILPELNEKGFLDEGEFIFSDDAQGIYVYINTGWKIVILRRFDGALPLTWFETDILCDWENGELITNIEVDPAKRHRVRADAAANALEHKVVFAANGDYYTYRMGSHTGHPLGIEIRDGEIYYDDHYDEEEKTYFPNMDTLAFYRDGRVDVHHSCEWSAQDYLDNDAYMVFSFGPYLLRDGELSEWVLDATKTKAKNPRHCFGMIEPGHYIDIMCEGRLGSRSEGVTMPQLAVMAQGAGMVECDNLDGGQTCVVVFMGKQLNQIGKYDGKTNARPTCEVFGGPFSDQVGTFEVK